MSCGRRQRPPLARTLYTEDDLFVCNETLKVTFPFAVGILQDELRAEAETMQGKDFVQAVCQPCLSFWFICRTNCVLRLRPRWASTDCRILAVGQAQRLTAFVVMSPVLVCRMSCGLRLRLPWARTLWRMPATRRPPRPASQTSSKRCVGFISLKI